MPEILQTLKDRTAVVVQAPPGAGKTTEVPLEILADQQQQRQCGERNGVWLGEDQNIVVLEPRRLAARNAAERMAQRLGQQCGETVGYRIRLDAKITPGVTRIECMTEGVLLRRLLDDPSLEGIGCVIFDEFHERSLDTDLAFCLCRDARACLRPDLRLVIMSATLGSDLVQRLVGGECIASNSKSTLRPLEDSALVLSKGREFPVTTKYLGAVPLKYLPLLFGKRDRRPVSKSLDELMSTAILEALYTHSNGGDVLAFLPGEAEIRATVRRLAASTTASSSSSAAPNGLKLPRDVEVLPLYGALPFHEQQRIVLNTGRRDELRRVIVASPIAEASLTLPRVTVVVDSGLRRVPTFDSGTGLSGLTTRVISSASAEQRAGRAGRVAAGTCLRLWAAKDQLLLKDQDTPSIADADLVSLALTAAVWIDDLGHVLEDGELSDAAVQEEARTRTADTTDTTERTTPMIDMMVRLVKALPWVDPPPDARLADALQLLTALGALNPAPEKEGRRKRKGALDNSIRLKVHVTTHGRRLARLPLHPRLAHMVIVAHDMELTLQRNRFGCTHKNGGKSSVKGSDEALGPITEEACVLAALLQENDIFRGDYARKEIGPDIRHRIRFLLDQKDSNTRKASAARDSIGHSPATVRAVRASAAQLKRMLIRDARHRRRQEEDSSQREKEGHDDEKPKDCRWGDWFLKDEECFGYAGALLSLAFPDRVAKRQRESSNGQPGKRCVMTNGVGAAFRNDEALSFSSALPPSSSSSQSATSPSSTSSRDWLVIAHQGGSGNVANRVIYLAAPISLEQLLFVHGHSWEAGLCDIPDGELVETGIITEEKVFVAASDGSVRRKSVTTLRGLPKLAIKEETLPAPSAEDIGRLLLEMCRDDLLTVLSRDQADVLFQLTHRMDLARVTCGDVDSRRQLFPDWSLEALQRDVEDWLGPWIASAANIKELQKIDVKMTLYASWNSKFSANSRSQSAIPSAVDLERLLDYVVPTHVELPTGSRARLTYRAQELFDDSPNGHGLAKDRTDCDDNHNDNLSASSENTREAETAGVVPPIFAAKLQELFGMESVPQVGWGRVKSSLLSSSIATLVSSGGPFSMSFSDAIAVPVVVDLLAPNGRPCARTADLLSFWSSRSGYPAVRSELRGRYSKHPWPEDPLTATPTTATNKKLRHSQQQQQQRGRQEEGSGGNEETARNPVQANRKRPKKKQRGKNKGH